MDAEELEFGLRVFGEFSNGIASERLTMATDDAGAGLLSRLRPPRGMFMPLAADKCLLPSFK
jgi:hypothetical protein